MKVLGRDHNKMPCESCAVQFSVFKRKRTCCECERYYCSACLRRGGGAMCAPCRVLSSRPLTRQNMAHLKVRDIQCFLQRQNVSTRGCVEKEELFNLCISHVNGSAYKRRGQRGNGNSFCTLKGFTNNINDFINSAFDLRTNPQPAPPPTSRNCYNSSHSHSQQTSSPNVPPQSGPERFTTTPGGEQDIFVPVPESRSEGSLRSPSEEHVDTADCLEIEDLDDQSWELINRPADPLPNDSEVLLSAAEFSVQSRENSERNITEPREINYSPIRSGLSLSGRAASEINLRATPSASSETDVASLQDEPLMDNDAAGPRQMTLEQFNSMSELESLNVKQLKELLTRHRVEFRGCIERADLLSRAQTLWRNHTRDKDEVDKLPLEECCKICMAAPLECVLLECGHIAACTDCSKQLAECPICRQYVVRAVRFFRS